MATHDQFGVFSRAQALGAGITRAMLTYHSRPGGRWEQVERSVFGLVGREPTWQMRLLAAQLSAGGAAVLSHRAAAAVLGLDGIDPDATEPELTGALDLRHERWIVHRRLRLASDACRTGPFVHTDAIRTVVDLATVISPNRVEAAIESALRLGLFDVAALRLAAEERYRRGAPRLRAVLLRRGVDQPPTESYLETVAVQLIRRCRGVPTPDRQVPIRIDGRVAFRLDLAWAPIRLFLEVDGRAFHDVSDEGFHYERWRRRQLVRTGWAPAELTARDLLAYPEATAREIEALVAARAREVGSRDRDQHSGRDLIPS